MRFRGEYEINPIVMDHRSLPQSFTVRTTRQHDACVTIESTASTADAVAAHSDVTCEVIVDFEPSSRVKADLVAIAERRVPSGTVPMSERPWWRDDDGRIKRGQRPSDDELAPHLRDAMKATSQELLDVAIRVVTLLRWRLGDDLASREPILRRDDYWSLNGEDWYRLSSPGATAGYVRDVPAVDSAVRADVQRFLDEGMREPLAHDLWREAWEFRQSNPRAAVLLGVTALEIGIKHYIASAVPGSRWLIDELQTPPAVRMLTEYLPRIAIGGAPRVEISPDEADVLRKATTLRNKVAHTDNASVDVNKFEATLIVIRRVLVRIDRAKGHSWA